MTSSEEQKNKARETLVDELARRVAARFRTFGGEAPVDGNPIAAALKGKPAEFAAGVDVREVVAFVVEEIHRTKDDVEDTPADKRLIYTVGAALRGSLRRLLEKERFKHKDIDIAFDERPGLVDSDFLIEVSGPEKKVNRWCAALEKHLKRS